ncbi:PREDICTED: protein DDC8 homolog [Chrysochloris asiatica]|uniref:Protein DDC8 homolog n=1 Tax=Chrysochloris asiatica TaxID=185453 RepID=A0A9B0WTP5_CHRAS|nr:PREDICTED: protein DDC8 homolog [Chrysochloris asiatica]
MSSRQRPDRQSVWYTNSRKKTSGTEKPGASNVTGVTQPPSSPTEKRRGKQRPSVKTSGEHRHLDIQGSRGSDADKLCPCPNETKHLEERGKDVAGDKTRQQDKEAFPQDGKHTCLDSNPDGRQKEQKQLWAAGSTSRKGVMLMSPPGKCGDVKKCHRELAFAFEELFERNQKLRNQQSLHFELRPRKGQSSTETSETQREKTRQAETTSYRTPRDPVDGHQTPSKVNLKKLLDKIETQKYRLAKCTFDKKDKMSKVIVKHKGQALSPEAEISVNGENLILCSPESEKEPSETSSLAKGSGQLNPREQADGVGRREAKQMSTLEMAPMRRKQLGLLEYKKHPKVKEILHGTQAEGKKAHSKPSTALVQGQEGGQESSTTSVSGVSNVLDGRHSQMILDLHQQILEQNKIHKQFLEEVRKRSQEFQKIC